MKNINIAVMIDGDNVPAKYVEKMLAEITKYGNPTIKRIYSDWTNPHVAGWKKVLLENAIIPVQQYAYTRGKNATDSAMIIDTMDVLYSGKVEGFCLVSSDSDFTRLATRLREAGCYVLGMGEKKTPDPFMVACDKFVYLEVLDEPESKKGKADKTKNTSSFAKITKKEIDLIKSTITDLSDDEGWAFLGDVGNLLQKKRPNFDSRNYGFHKLTPLIDSIGLFEISKRSPASAQTKLIYVRVKD